MATRTKRAARARGPARPYQLARSAVLPSQNDDNVVSLFPDPLGPTSPATGEIGITGTANYSGQLFAEQNPELINERGYGRVGTRTWGEYELVTRTDSAVASALELIVAPLRDAEVGVEAAKDADDEELAQTQAEYIADNLLEWMDPQWTELCQQMARGFLGSGFSIHEPVLGTRPDKRLPSGFGYFLDRMPQRLPNTLMYNGWVEQDGDLAAIRQQGTVDGKWRSGVLLPAERIILCSWNREGNNYAGFPQTRSVYYLCKIREQLLRIIGIGHQRESCGIPIATSDREQKLTDGQRKKIRVILENCIYHENAAVVLPSGVKLEWWTSPGANKGHVVDTWHRLGIAILEVFQAQQMSLGTGATGSRSVGQVHDDNKRSFVSAVRSTILGALNGVGRRKYTGLVRRIVDANWGPQAKYPKITITLPVSQLQPQDFVTAAVAAKTGGLLLWTDRDQVELRDKLGMEQLTPEELESAKAEKDAAAAAIKGAQPPGEPLPNGAPAKPTMPAPQGPLEDAGGVGLAAHRVNSPVTAAFSQRAPGEPFVPRRPLHPHEDAVDFGAMDDLLSQARTVFEEGARPLLVEALVRAMPQVREAMKDGDPSDIAGVKLDTARLSAFIREFLERLRAEGYKHVAKERANPAKAKAVVEQRTDGVPPASVGPLDKPITATARQACGLPFAFMARRIAFDVKTPPLDTESFLDSSRDLILRRMHARILDVMHAAALRKMRTGGDSEEIVADTVDHALTSGALKTDAGMVTSSAFNVGREQFAREHGDEVASVHLSALLDANTCSGCERLDGAEFDFGSAEHDEHVPPLTDVCDGGDNCRCVLTYQFQKPGDGEGNQDGD